MYEGGDGARAKHKNKTNTKQTPQPTTNKTHTKTTPTTTQAIASTEVKHEQ